MTRGTPALPDLPTDAILEVYTHTSLGGMGFPTNGNLIVLGTPTAEASMALALLVCNPNMGTAALLVSSLR